MPEPPGTGAASTPGRRAPVVAVTAPVPGATFSSALNMAATATDDHGVSRVEFWVDGARVARDTAAPYAATFTANRAMSYAMHTVAVRAFDAAGPASSAAVTVMRVRSGAQTKRVATSAAGRPRAGAFSDTGQSTLVPVSMWRIASTPADGTGTVLRGPGMPGRTATVSLTRCGDSSGAVAALMQLNASTDGTLYARQSADGLCVLRIKPFGEA